MEMARLGEGNRKKEVKKERKKKEWKYEHEI
jgi:hypothetical protein